MYDLTSEMREMLCDKLPIEKYYNRTFFITGATGLVGSLLVKCLLFLNDIYKLNLKVIGAIRDEGKANAIFKDYNDKALSFLKFDLNDDGCEITETIDYIIHTAAVTSSKMMVSKPVETIKTMVIGTDRILQLAHKKSVSAMVYVSSMEVYGNMISNDKASEDKLGYIDISQIRSCYPESKRLSEMLCNAYAFEYGVNVKTVRLAQTFGAGVLPTENRVFAQFARCLINGEDIVLHTEGKSEGNYVYTLDAMSGILMVLTEGVKGNAYNISNEDCHMTIREMAELVASLSKDGKISVKVDIPEEDMGYAKDVKLWLDNNKARALGWSPSIGMKESYSRMIGYMLSECEEQG